MRCYLRHCRASKCVAFITYILLYNTTGTSSSCPYRLNRLPLHPSLHDDTVLQTRVRDRRLVVVQRAIGEGGADGVWPRQVFRARAGVLISLTAL